MHCLEWDGIVCEASFRYDVMICFTFLFLITQSSVNTCMQLQDLCCTQFLFIYTLHKFGDFFVVDFCIICESDFILLMIYIQVSWMVDSLEIRLILSWRNNLLHLFISSITLWLVNISISFISILISCPSYIFAFLLNNFSIFLKALTYFILLVSLSLPINMLKWPL